MKHVMNIHPIYLRSTHLAYLVNDQVIMKIRYPLKVGKFLTVVSADQNLLKVCVPTSNVPTSTFLGSFFRLLLDVLTSEPLISNLGP